MDAATFSYEPQALPTYIDAFRSKLKVAVIYGANKDEPGAVIHSTANLRPWKSYKSVAEDIANALSELGFQQVNTLADDLNLLPNLQRLGTHLVWLNTGGVQGYDPLSHAASFMEMAGVPYIGHDPMTAGLLDNKILFKQTLVALGLPTPKFTYWSPTHGDFCLNSPRLQPILDYVEDGPLIVKPASGRASLYVEYVCDKRELPRAVEAVYRQTHHDVLIEEYLSGQEYCVSVCGPILHNDGQYKRLPAPFAFSTLERNFEEGEKVFTSMDKKTITKDRARLLNEREDEQKRQQLISLGQSIYTEFNLSCLVRADLRANREGELFFLECNPKPDLKRPSAESTSLAALGLEAEAMNYTDLILSLLADRLDFLFRYRLPMIRNLVALL